MAPDPQFNLPKREKSVEMNCIAAARRELLILQGERFSSYKKSGIISSCVNLFLYSSNESQSETGENGQ